MENSTAVLQKIRSRITICCMRAQSLQLCPILCEPKDCSPPGSSVHGIFQARTLEWVAMPSSRGSSQARDWTCISCIAGEFFNAEPPGKHWVNIGSVKLFYPKVWRGDGEFSFLRSSQGRSAPHAEKGILGHPEAHMRQIQKDEGNHSAPNPDQFI